MSIKKRTILIFPLLISMLSSLICWAGVDSEDRYKEEDLLIKFRKRVSRNGPKLIIKTKDGKKVIFEDQGGPIDTRDGYVDSPNEVNYVLSDYRRKHDIFVIWESRYEGTVPYYMVSGKNGEKTAIGAGPLYSPDNNRFITHDSGEFDGGEVDLFLTVWEFKDGSVHKRWHRGFEDLNKEKWGPEKARWLNNTVIEVKTKVPIPDEYMSKPGPTKYLILENDSWTLKSEKPATIK